jgi:hypothetical protein
MNTGDTITNAEIFGRRSFHYVNQLSENENRTSSGNILNITRQQESYIFGYVDETPHSSGPVDSRLSQPQWGVRCSVVVKALCYKPEGSGFNSR